MDEMSKYRLVSGYGSHMNKRWEVQEQYSYYDDYGNKVESWHMVFHSTNKQACEQALKRYESDEFQAMQDEKKNRLKVDFDWMN